MNYILIKEVSYVLRTLNHKTRQEILKNISENNEVGITDLSKKMRLDVSILSQHLALLRKSKIVNITRDGKYVKFKINNEYLSLIDNFIKNFIIESKKFECS